MINNELGHGPTQMH